MELTKLYDAIAGVPWQNTIHKHNEVAYKTNPAAFSIYRSDDSGRLEPVLSHMTQQIAEMTSEIQALKNDDQEQEQARGNRNHRLPVPEPARILRSLAAFICIFNTAFS